MQYVSGLRIESNFGNYTVFGIYATSQLRDHHKLVASSRQSNCNQRILMWAISSEARRSNEIGSGAFPTRRRRACMRANKQAQTWNTEESTRRAQRRSTDGTTVLTSTLPTSEARSHARPVPVTRQECSPSDCGTQWFLQPGVDRTPWWIGRPIWSLRRRLTAKMTLRVLAW